MPRTQTTLRRRRAPTMAPTPEQSSALSEVSDVTEVSSGGNGKLDGSLSAMDRLREEGSAWASVRTLLQAIVALLALILLAQVYSRRDEMGEHLRLFNDQLKTHLPNLPHNFTNPLNVLNLPGMNFSNYYPYEAAKERPGLEALREGLKPKHPIFMIPGFTTTGLEVWGGHPCAKKYFRERFWGTLTMMQTFLLDKNCWIQHLKLNHTTGSDPDGIKLRPSQGLEAVDYFMPGFFVWGRLIESMADIGYDSNNMHSAPYDWRLSLHMMEERDSYFSNLKATLEVSLRKQGEKALVATHSFGDQVLRYFMAWVESPLGGNGGPGWVDQHIAVWCNIGGPTLGVPKAISSLLSGETRDTTELQGLQWYLGEWSLPQGTRADLFRSWGSVLGMIPHGGELVWGGADGEAPEDGSGPGSDLHTGPFLHLAPVPSAGPEPPVLREGGNLTVMDGLDLLSQLVPTVGHNMRRWHSYGSDPKGRLLKGGDPLGERHWANALEMALPNAPNMKIFCHYGYGLPTERAYRYEAVAAPAAPPPPPAPAAGAAAEPQPQQQPRPAEEFLSAIKIAINRTLSSRHVSKGVTVVDGDGTVPLLSLGYMCQKGWKSARFNPAGIPCVAREYLDRQADLLSAGGMQGGPETADHVNIMGNHEMMMDIIRVAVGRGGDLEEMIGSEIREIAERVPLSKLL